MTQSETPQIVIQMLGTAPPLRVLQRPLTTGNQPADLDETLYREALRNLAVAYGDLDQDQKAVVAEAIMRLVCEELVTYIGAERGPLHRFMGQLQESATSYKEMLG